MIWVRAGKNNAERFVPFTAKCEELIKEYLSARKDSLNILFVSGKNKRISVRRVQDIIKEYAAQFGQEKNICVHMFRHTFATKLTEKGAKPEIVADLLGHKSLRYIKVYSQLSDSARRSKYDKYR